MCQLFIKIILQVIKMQKFKPLTHQRIFPLILCILGGEHAFQEL